ncbi:MAG: hypothetical protein WC462_03020 [archaeon]
MIRAIKRYSERRRRLTNSMENTLESLRIAKETGLELNGIIKAARRERTALNGARNNEAITHYRALKKIIKQLELIDKSRFTKSEKNFMGQTTKALESKAPIKEQQVLIALEIMRKYSPLLAENAQRSMTQRGYKGKLYSNKNRVN